MGRINIDIPDAVHDELRHESRIRNVPIKQITIEALVQHIQTRDIPGDEDRDLPELDE